MFLWTSRLHSAPAGGQIAAQSAQYKGNMFAVISSKNIHANHVALLGSVSHSARPSAQVAYPCDLFCASYMHVFDQVVQIIT